MVNPAQLKSLVDLHAASPGAVGGAASPDAMPEDGDLGDDDDMDEEAPQDPASKGEALLAGWGEFGESLKDAAKDVHDLAHDIGGDLMLKDVPDDAEKELGKAVDRMPDDLQQGLAKYVSKLSPEDTDALSAALCKEIGEDQADQKLMTAFLTQAGKYAADEVDVDDDFNEDEEDDEDDDDDADGEDGEGNGDSAGGDGSGGAEA